jgi:hypothetical protein
MQLRTANEVRMRGRKMRNEGIRYLKDEESVVDRRERGWLNSAMKWSAMRCGTETWDTKGGYAVQRRLPVVAQDRTGGEQRLARLRSKVASVDDPVEDVWVSCDRMVLRLVACWLEPRNGGTEMKQKQKTDPCCQALKVLQEENEQRMRTTEVNQLWKKSWARRGSKHETESELQVRGQFGPVASFSWGREGAMGGDR